MGRVDTDRTLSELSVVVSVYKSADSLGELHRRLTGTLVAMGVSYELLFVDDRSPDDAWPQLTELSAVDPHVIAIRFSLNFGQHAAITAGIAESRGRYVLVMDGDLQDRPEDIPRLCEQASQTGAAIVFARRRRRQHHWSRRAAARMYFRLMRIFTGVAIQGEYGSFSLIERRVADAYLRVHDRGRHYLFILYWLGFEHTEIVVDHSARASGSSSYTFAALVRHAMQGLFFQTTRLLRWIVYLGFAVAVAGVGVACYLTYVAIVAHPYPGWTSLAVLILLIGGMIITSVGVTGLYIEQIFDQVKDRPLYVVDDRVGSN